MTTTPPITIPIYSVTANAVSNPLYTINAANAVYKEEQRPELNITFTVMPQGVDDLFRYNTAAIIHVCKDYNCFITFKPYFKPILHSNSLSDITSTGTVVLKINTMVRL